MTIAIVNGERVEVRADEAAAFEAQRAIIAEQAHVAAIRAEAATRIDAVAPLYKQQNAATLRLELLGKRLSGAELTPDDLEAEAQARAMSERIEAIRATSKAAVRGGLSLDAVEWPEVSQ